MSNLFVYESQGYVYVEKSNEQKIYKKESPKEEGFFSIEFAKVA